MTQNELLFTGFFFCENLLDILNEVKKETDSQLMKKLKCQNQ